VETEEEKAQREVAEEAERIRLEQAESAQVDLLSFARVLALRSTPLHSACRLAVAAKWIVSS
jgi:hypothetical protein